MGADSRKGRSPWALLPPSPKALSPRDPAASPTCKSCYAVCLEFRPRPGAAISQSSLEEFLRARRLEDIELGDLDPVALVARYDLPVQLDFESVGFVEPLLPYAAGREVDGVAVALFGPEHHRIGPLEIALANLALLGAFLPDDPPLDLGDLLAEGRAREHGQQHGNQRPTKPGFHNLSSPPASSPAGGLALL